MYYKVESTFKSRGMAEVDSTSPVNWDILGTTGQIWLKFCVCSQNGKIWVHTKFQPNRSSGSQDIPVYRIEPFTGSVYRIASIISAFIWPLPWGSLITFIMQWVRIILTAIFLPASSSRSTGDWIIVVVVVVVPTKLQNYRISCC